MSTTAHAGDPIRFRMAAVNDLFNSEVFGKENYAAFDSIYTSDARILPPGGPMVSGAKALRLFGQG